MKINIKRSGISIFGLPFIGVLGIIATLFIFLNAMDVIVLSTQYTCYDGVVVDHSSIRSELVERRETTNGKSRTVTRTVYKQDIVVSYNDKEVRKNNLSVSSEGHPINEKFYVFESKNNPDKIKLFKYIPSKTWCVISLIGIVIFWIVFVRKVIKVIRNFMNNLKSSAQTMQDWDSFNYLNSVTEYDEMENGSVEEQ